MQILRIWGVLVVTLSKIPNLKHQAPNSKNLYQMWVVGIWNSVLGIFLIMKIRQNTFKQNLLKGIPQYGIWNGLVDSYAAEICAGAGFDWITIDGEHAPFDLRTILHNMQAIQSHGVSAVVRIPAADPVIIKQLLDTGAQNILVPMIETADQAELVAKAMRYPPIGIRGVGTALARAAQWNRVDNYFQLANDQMCCMGQIESIKAVEALDEILEVEGLDICFIGPADLGATMGYLGQAGHPEVVKLVKDCIKRIVKAGKIAGFLTGSKALIQDYLDAGALMAGVGLDTLILAKGTKRLAEEYKTELKEDQSSTEY